MYYPTVALAADCGTLLFLTEIFDSHGLSLCGYDILLTLSTRHHGTCQSACGALLNPLLCRRFDVYGQDERALACASAGRQPLRGA